MKAVSPSAISLTALLLTAITATAADPSTALGFTTPATKFEQSLPLGNGRMGAMIFGGVDNERIILNESSLWSGSPEDNACGRELVQSNRCHAIAVTPTLYHKASVASRGVLSQRATAARKHVGPGFARATG